MNGKERFRNGRSGRGTAAPALKQRCMYITQEAGYGFNLIGGSLLIYLDQEEGSECEKALPALRYFVG